eukprot:2772905-Alexandrium_andersonii.AAC.1
MIGGPGGTRGEARGTVGAARAGGTSARGGTGQGGARGPCLRTRAETHRIPPVAPGPRASRRKLARRPVRTLRRTRGP